MAVRFPSPGRHIHGGHDEVVLLVGRSAASTVKRQAQHRMRADGMTKGHWYFVAQAGLLTPRRVLTVLVLQAPLRSVGPSMEDGLGLSGTAGRKPLYFGHACALQHRSLVASPCRKQAKNHVACGNTTM